MTSRVGTLTPRAFPKISCIRLIPPHARSTTTCIKRPHLILTFVLGEKNQQEGVEWNKHWGGFVWLVGFLRGKCEDKLNWSGLEDISRFQGERLRRKSALYVSSRVCQLVPFSMGCWQRHALGAGRSVYTTIRKFTGDTRANQNIQGQLCA